MKRTLPSLAVFLVRSPQRLLGVERAFLSSHSTFVSVSSRSAPSTKCSKLSFFLYFHFFLSYSVFSFPALCASHQMKIKDTSVSTDKHTPAHTHMHTQLGTNTLAENFNAHMRTHSAPRETLHNYG